MCIAVSPRCVLVAEMRLQWLSSGNVSNHEAAADVERLPVIQCAAGEHKKRTTSATSSAFPRRPNGLRSIARRKTSGSEKYLEVMSLSTYPGATAFTLIFRGDSSNAQLFVNESTAAFVAPYKLRPAAIPTLPATDEMLTMFAPSSRYGKAA